MKRITKNVSTSVNHETNVRWQRIYKPYNLVLRIIKYLLNYIYERPMILFVSEMNKKKIDLIGVEIGVYKGDNALFILSHLPIKKLFLIDPYLEYKEIKRNFGWSKVNQSDYNKFFKQAKKKLGKFGDKIVFIKEKSADAACHVPNNLDFVYIDGNHEYNFVKRDIELYYSKLKHGGILGGDNFDPIFLGVVRAVLEFSDKHNLKIHGAKSDANYEWWVIKP